MKFQVGQQATTRRAYTASDIAEYAILTGAVLQDPNRIPGPLLGALFSYLLGTTLPGRGTNYLKQRLEFPAPAHVGEEITAKVEIIRLRPDKDLVNLKTVCTNPRGETVCRGEALVKVKDVE